MEIVKQFITGIEARIGNARIPSDNLVIYFGSFEEYRITFLEKNG